ncbi:MAG: TonB-dependent siderophore receptor, partial [Pseudomonadales bacterium]|nr:TonB-dependent siderophore receptor [Pseudomonadales bacterium]
IRGYSARTDIFVDNVRDFGGYTRDPFNLEQVEVVKGPSSDYSGRGSTGGSINLVSKSPTLGDESLVDASVGSDAFTRVTLDANRMLGESATGAARLNLMYHKQDVAGRDHVSNERWGIAPSLAFGLETDTRVTLSAFHMTQDNVPDYGIPWVPDSNVPLADYANEPAPVPFSNWYGLTARDYEKVATSMFTVKLERNLGERAVLSNVTRYGLTDRDSMITAPRFASTTGTEIRRSDEKYRDQEDDIVSNQTNLVLSLGDRLSHRVLLGMEISREGEKRYTRVPTGPDSPDTDLYAPDAGDPYLEQYVRTGTASTADSDSVAFYASDSIDVGEHWQLNGGLRWDRFALEYTPDGSPLLERTDEMLSYRAGVVYKPVERGSVYLGYGTSFNPTAETLSISTSSRQPGIADLDPEENTTLELGTKWQLVDRRLFFSAAVFRTEKVNARTQDPDDPNDLLVLDGRQRVDGIEISLAGSITERLSIFTGYTFLDSAVTESKDASEVGRQLANTPANSFNWWSKYRMNDRLELGFGAQYVDDRFNSTSNTRVAPAYWVFEASGSWQASRYVNIRLNVQNLTDEPYIDYVGGGHFIPGVGRTILLSSSFTF